jgi:hypothetical protein
VSSLWKYRLTLALAIVATVYIVFFAVPAYQGPAALLAFAWVGLANAALWSIRCRSCGWPLLRRRPGVVAVSRSATHCRNVVRI